MEQISLRAARVNANMRQKDVAKALNVSEKTLSSWECGEIYPRVNMVYQLCRLYDVTIDQIIFLPDNPLKGDNEDAHRVRLRGKSDGRSAGYIQGSVGVQEG